MARFRAYTSDSGSSSDEEKQPPRRSIASKPVLPKKLVREPADDDESEESHELTESEASSSESSSDMDEDDRTTSSRAEPSSRNKNALVQDEDGEIRYAHEVDNSTTFAPKSRSHLNGDTTIIPWAQQLGVDAQKMHVMQTSLFRMPEEAAALKALNQPSAPRTSVKRLEVEPQTKTATRKHGRDPDVDGLRLDARERRSFAHDAEPPMSRPSRKYARVDKTSSIVNGHEGSFVDAGLALGRSFRVGWGPGGILAHLGSICNPNSSPPSANSSVMNLTSTTALLASNSVNGSGTTGPTIPSVIALSSKLLQHHLSHTPISSDITGVPVASPPSLQSTSTTSSTHPPPTHKYLDFASFSSLFPSTDLSIPATLFRLGVSLFDPIDLRLGSQRVPSTLSSSTVTPDIRNQIIALRRKAALGQWLEETVRPNVESDLRTKANGLVSGGAYTPADAAFTYLTGHQIEKACSVAAEGGYLKLSTLISQAGGDGTFKDDIQEQLRVWKTEKLGPSASTSSGSGLVGRGVWKVYSLLGGLLNDDEDELSEKDADVCSGLDWKRTLGLCLWYGEGLEALVADVVKAYEQLWSRLSEPLAHRGKPVARPIPSWLLDAQRKKHPLALISKWSNWSVEPDDPLYALIKLHADPALSLSKMLDPLSFSCSLMEGGIAMCWHLYIILSRVMRVRDFADRQPAGSRRTLMNGVNGSGHDESSDEEDRHQMLVADGHSPTADLLSSAYAFELESWGMIQEAIFVLLHIEGSVGREKTIKELLGRSAPHLDDWMTRGIVGSLKIPMTWVEEAKAQYALSNGDFFSAYELFLSAGQYNTAHNIAVLELAPEVILARDLELLEELLEIFDSETKHDKIDGWFTRGKVLLDYVHIMNRLPKLQDQLESDNEDERLATIDAAITQEIDDLTRRIPRVIAMLPDMFYRGWTVDPRHTAATEDMVRNLLAVTERVKSIALTQIQQPTLAAVDSAIKIGLVSSVGLARFVKTIEA